jgi:hypothetical protein
MVLGLAAMTLLMAGCAARKKNAEEHFGTQVNWPTFAGPQDFFHRLGQVNSILYTHKLDGKPVDMEWISPAFREQLCLTLTINNHCVG